MTGALLFEQIVNGLVLGAAYALLGSGLALVYGTMRLFNFAHGEMYMAGGFAMFFLVSWGVPAFLAAPLAICLAALIGAAVQRLTLRPLMDQEGWAFSTIAATLGISIVLQQSAQHLFGERPKAIPYYIDGVLDIGPVTLPLQRVLIFLVAIIVMAAMALALSRTRFGRAIRAVSQDPEAAAVIGVPTPAVHTAVFAASAGLGALAAILLAPIYGVSPWMGAPLMIKAFVVVVLGGLGSFGGAIAGGFLLGIIEAIGITVTASEWRDVISFGVLLTVIWIRPRGLFGAKVS